MSALKGMMSIGELKAAAAADEIDTVLVAFTDHYGRVHGKRIAADYFNEEVADHGTHGCDYLLTVDMEMEPIPGYRYANWELGYGDFHMVPDLATLRRAAWLDRSAIVLCDLIDPRTHELVEVAPRTILRRQVERLAEMGYAAKAGSELEYFIYEDSYRQGAELRYQGLTPAGWYIEDYHLLQGTREEAYNAVVRRHLRDSGIPPENSKGEWGRGQHEMNIRYAGVLEMADRHTIMKLLMKDTAEIMGKSVTFMAKPDMSEAGSSCHLHVSVWSETGNAFPGDMVEGPLQVSETFRWFLGGWMAHFNDVMPFYAPTINSYRRYQDQSWAPTRIAWSHDNRTAGFRIVGEGNSLRIECRIPGADTNPYLAYAAVLASGIDGINNKLDPPQIFTGDVYMARELPHVPKTLRDATDGFAASQLVKQAFGDLVQEHYTHFFRVEQDAFDNTVTDWERWRYFERI
ncbi:MAG: glutamine synthetase family protein [Actinobacteria bacterium]|nr:glutamine synthetase family protein [Actinomycetota bacterium]MCI0679229.1 glutamine synthetase family protein [Actinomycetota bacterium]